MVSQRRKKNVLFNPSTPQNAAKHVLLNITTRQNVVIHVWLNFPMSPGAITHVFWSFPASHPDAISQTSTQSTADHACTQFRSRSTGEYLRNSKSQVLRSAHPSIPQVFMSALLQNLILECPGPQIFKPPSPQVFESSQEGRRQRRSHSIIYSRAGRG